MKKTLKCTNLLIVFFIMVISIVFIYKFLDYEGRIYEKEINEVWKTYFYDAHTKKMTTNSICDMQVIKKESNVLIEFDNERYIVDLSQSILEIRQLEETIRIWFGENFDAISIEYWKNNKLEKIYFGLKDDIPLFNNTYQNRIKMLKRISLTAAPIIAEIE